MRRILKLLLSHLHVVLIKCLRLISMELFLGSLAFWIDLAVPRGLWPPLHIVLYLISLVFVTFPDLEALADVLVLVALKRIHILLFQTSFEWGIISYFLLEALRCSCYVALARPRSISTLCLNCSSLTRTNICTFALVQAK